MIKKIKDVELFPTITDLNVFLSKLGYDSDRVFFVARQYNIARYYEYCSDPYTVNGLGVFKDVNDKNTCCIFDRYGQRIFILDQSILDLIENPFSTILVIFYENAFTDSFDFQKAIDKFNKDGLKEKTSILISN